MSLILKYRSIRSEQYLGNAKLLQPHFDYVFEYHSRIHRDRGDRKASHLPCAYALSRSAELAEILRGSKIEERYHATFPLALYPGAERNKVCLWVREYARLGNYNIFVGELIDSSEVPRIGYMLHLLSASFGINASLKQDLNMRNFEALALDRKLVTDDSARDLWVLENFSDSIFKDSLSDKKLLFQAMENGLSAGPAASSTEISQKHSLGVRLRKITSTIFPNASDKIDEAIDERKNSAASMSWRSGSGKVLFEETSHDLESIYANLSMLNFPSPLWNCLRCESEKI